MATGQLISRRCRATQLLSLLLLFGCSCCYVFTTVLLRHAVPCSAAEGDGEPQPAPPSAAVEPEEGNPPPAPPVKAEEEPTPEPASSVPTQPSQTDGKEATGEEKLETDSAPVDLPDEPIRCGLPLRTLPYNRKLKAVSGIYSLDYCQKLCVQERDCEIVEWDVQIGLCYLTALPEDILSYSTVSRDSTSPASEGNRDQADSHRPSPLRVSQDQEPSRERLKEQRLADSAAVAAVDQQGSAAYALVEERSYWSSFSPVSPVARRGTSIFSIPSKPSHSIAKNSFVSTAATSLSQSSASISPSPSPSRDGAAATSVSAGRDAAAAAAVSSSSRKSRRTPPATPRAGEVGTVKPYLMEDLIVQHTQNMVAPRTCGVSCWLVNYKCSEVLPPRHAALRALGIRKNALPISRGGKFFLASKAQRKSEEVQSTLTPSEGVFNPFDCHRLCYLDEACGAFSWNRFRNRCHLCPVITFPSQAVLTKKAFFASVRSHLTSDHSYVTGPKQSCLVSGPDDWITPVFQTCFHGNKSTESPSVTILETLPLVPTPDDCQTQCFAKSGCHHFTWEYHTLNCMLKSGPIHNTLVTARSSITGPKSCFKGCLKIGVSYPKEYVIQTITAASVFDCKVACAAQTSPRCEGVTYYFATHKCDLAGTGSVAGSAYHASSFVSSSSSSMLSAASSSVASSAGVDNFLQEAATTQRILPVSTPSFISTGPAKPEGPLQPDAVCSMCASEAASLCRIALPESGVSSYGTGARFRSSTRKRGRHTKEKQKAAKRTDQS